MSSAPLCLCGKQTRLTTCWRDDNPGRRFYGCSRWPRPERCSFFVWYDKPMCARSRTIIPG